MMEQKKPENLFGTIALKLGLITEKQLQDGLEIQKFIKDPRPLGHVLQRMGILTAGAVDSVITYQSRELLTHDNPILDRKEDKLFGSVLIQLKFARKEQVTEALAIQKSLPKDQFKRIGEIMVERGLIRIQHVYEALRRQDVMTVFCPQCQTRYNAMMFNKGAELACYKCSFKFTLTW